MGARGLNNAYFQATAAYRKIESVVAIGDEPIALLLSIYPKLGRNVNIGR
jgi:hypothetical protein